MFDSASQSVIHVLFMNPTFVSSRLFFFVQNAKEVAVCQLHSNKGKPLDCFYNLVHDE